MDKEKVKELVKSLEAEYILYSEKAKNIDDEYHCGYHQGLAHAYSVTAERLKNELGIDISNE